MTDYLYLGPDEITFFDHNKNRRRHLCYGDLVQVTGRLSTANVCNVKIVDGVARGDGVYVPRGCLVALPNGELEPAA